MRKLVYAVGTVFGLGYSPKAPGTMGSLPPLFIFYLISNGFGASSYTTVRIVVLLLTTVMGCVASYFIEKWEQSEDPGKIVIDEFVGQWICLSFLSYSALVNHTWLILVGFGLFRYFDIRKPSLIKKFEKFPHGFGVMADDMLSGLVAGILLWGLAWLMM